MSKQTMRATMARAAGAVRRRLARGPIDEHVLSTYTSLRGGLFLLAALFPFLVVGLGLARGVDVQQSLSAYYFAFAGAGHCIEFPVRTLFTGALMAISVGLYLYKGFTARENLLLNAAALFGLGVAFVPKGVDDALLASCAILQPIRDAQGWWPYVHFTSAGLMFVCLAAVAWFCAGETLSYLPARHRDKEAGFRRRYKTIALAMLGAIAATLLLEWVLHEPRAILYGEAFGIWVFAWYWFEKTREMRLSHAEMVAVQHRQDIDESPPDGQGGPGLAGGELLVHS